MELCIRPRPAQRLTGLLTCLLVCSNVSYAGDIQPRGLLPADPLVLVEIERPLRLLDHPLAKQLWMTLQDSEQLKRQLTSPEYDQLQAVLELVREEFGVGWRKAFEKLTTGGLLMAVEEGTPPKTTIVLSADEPTTILQLGSFVKKLAAAQARQKDKQQTTEAKTHRETTYYKSGDGYYAVSGRRLIVTSSNELMQRAIDRLLDNVQGDAKGNPLPEVAASTSLARISINMQAIRKLPGAAETFKIPTTNIAQIFLVGDSLDLISRSDRITVDVIPAAETLNLDVRFSAKQENVTPGLEGYFAMGQEQTAAPLLKVPETLFTTSWYRDYGSIWDGRSKLLVERSLKSVDEGNRGVKNQLAIVGASFLPSAMLKSLGPHFRIVVARQQQSVYQVELDGRFPAAALVIDLRDEEYFTKKVVPAIRAGYGLATASQQPRVIAKESKYKDVKLLSLMFDDEEEAAAVGNRARFNASPTFTVAHKHFIIGSTREIVEQVIDSLAAPQVTDLTNPDGATSRQLTLIPTATRIAKEFQSPLVRNIVFGQGLSIKEAQHELDVLLRIVAGFKQVSVTSGFDDEGYVYRIQFGPEKK